MKKKTKNNKRKTKFYYYENGKKKMKMGELSNFKHLIVNYKNKQTFDKSVMI